MVLISVARALSLAHVLEWPGKMRLDEHTYLDEVALAFHSNDEAFLPSPQGQVQPRH